MKIAIYCAGHIRSFEHVYPTWQSNLIKGHDVDFFIHCWNDVIGFRNDNVSTAVSDIGVHDQSRFSFENEQKLIDALAPKAFIFESSYDVEKHIRPIAEKYYNFASCPHDRIFANMCQWHGKNKALSLGEEYKFKTGTTYDLEIMIRFDLHIGSKIVLENVDSNVCNTTKFGNWYGFSDFIIISNGTLLRKVMNATTEESLDNLILNKKVLFNPHLIFKTFCEDNNILLQQHMWPVGIHRENQIVNYPVLS